jgi:hypothetical protein
MVILVVSAGPSIITIRPNSVSIGLESPFLDLPVFMKS